MSEVAITRKSFLRTALFIAAEYCAASTLAVFHLIKVGVELGREDGDAIPPVFAILVIAAVWGSVTLILYVLAIWIAKWRIHRGARICIVVILQIPLFVTASFVAFGLWIDFESWETIAAATIYSVVVLQAPVLVSRLLESTRS